ncbi:MAG: hypothetical protein AB7S63_06285 [Thauera sp.]
MREALDDEHHAWATYDQVIADFGEVAPFVNIRAAEARHIEALRVLYRRFGLPVPENEWLGRAARYPSLQAASEAGVVAEVANAGLYDRLLADPVRPEIAAVLQRLRQASQERHLPAFRRCAERQEAGGGAAADCAPGRPRRWRGGRD